MTLALLTLVVLGCVVAIVAVAGLSEYAVPLALAYGAGLGFR